MEKQTKIPECMCCGKAGETVVEYGTGDRMTVCWPCARLATSELEQDAHGTYRPTCWVADR